MVEPRRRLCKRQFVGSNAPEEGGVGAPNALWVRELARQTPRQHIQDALLFFHGIALFDQNLPLANLASKATAKFTAGRALGLAPLNLAPHCQSGRGAARVRTGIGV